MWDVIVWYSILIVIFSKVNAIKLVCLPNLFLFIISAVSILVKEVLGLARSSQEQARPSQEQAHCLSFQQYLTHCVHSSGQ